MNKKSPPVFTKTALRFSWVISLGLHSLVVLALLLTVRCDSNTSAPPQAVAKPIKAVVINEKAIRDKKEKIRQQQLAKKRKEQQRLERIRQEKLKKKRLAEQKRIKAKKEKEALKKKKIATERTKKIARDKAKKAKKERQKKAQEKAQQEQIKKKQAEEQHRKQQQRKLEQKRLADQRDKANAQAEADFMAKMLKEQRIEEQRIADELMRNEQTDINQANEAHRQTEITKYKGYLRDKITRNWNRPKNTPSGLSCTLEVHLIPGGDVADVIVTHSSGNAIFDRSAENAVKKAAPLPIPNDIGLFYEFKIITYNFNPDE